MIVDFGRERVYRLKEPRNVKSTHNGNERVAASIATDANLHSAGVVNCLFPYAIISESHNSCTHAAGRLVSYVVQHSCA